MDVTVTVTPFFGDPDLYLSTTQHRPNETAEFSNTAYLGDSITVSGACLPPCLPACLPACLWACMRAGLRACGRAGGRAFDVPVSLCLRTRAIPSLWCLGTWQCLPALAFAHRDFFVRPSASDRACPPLLGCILLLAATDPRKGAACLANRGMCTYYVAVYGYSLINSYTISVTFTRPRMLTDGVPSTGSCLNGG